MKFKRLMSWSLLLFALAWLPASATASVTIDLQQADAMRQLQQARQAGQSVRLALAGELSKTHQATHLILQPMYISDGNSRLVIHGLGGVVSEQPLPERHYWQGYLEGDLYSRALLTEAKGGIVGGLLRNDIGVFSVLDAGKRGLVLSDVDLNSEKQSFECGAEHLEAPPVLPVDTVGDREPGAMPANGYIARIAMETDYEYYQKFNDTDDAAVYAMDLVAYASTIYDDELATRMAVSSISLWTDSSDPWDEFSTGCGLYEFGRYWNDNNSSESRTIAHMLSGKNNGGGIAWVGVLCRGEFNTNIGGRNCSTIPNNTTDNFGGDYGYTGTIDGNFDLNSPSVLWDIVAFSHEVGHNFRSPHTHCYAGLEGNSNPVDECYAAEPGCFAGAGSLPGPQGSGSGTIMSYCHLRSGGMSNISLTLGTDHPYGVAPERVPTRMLNHVESSEGIFPGCLTTELQPTLSMSIDDADIVEGEDLIVDLSLDRTAASDITVNLAIDGSLSGELSNLSAHVINQGSTSLQISLPSADDSSYSAVRSGNVSVDSTSGASLIDATAPIAATITDDEPRPVVLSFTPNTFSLSEGDTLSIGIAMDQSTSVPVDVTFSLAASLAARTQSSLGPHSIAAGQTSLTVDIAFDDDNIDAPDLSGTLAIASISSTAASTVNGDESWNVQLLDDDIDPVELSLNLDQLSLTEGETLLATISLDQTTSVPVNVALNIDAALGARLVTQPGQQVIAAGDDTTVFSLEFDDDTMAQGVATGTIAIGAVSSAAATSNAAPDSYQVQLFDDESLAIFSDSFGS